MADDSGDGPPPPSATDHLMPPPVGLTLRLWSSRRARPGKVKVAGGGKAAVAAAPLPPFPPVPSSPRPVSGDENEGEAGDDGDSDDSSSASDCSSTPRGPSLDGWGGPADVPGVPAASPVAATTLAAATRALGRWFSGEAARFNAGHAAGPPPDCPAGAEEEFILLAARRARAVCASAMAGVVGLVSRGSGGSGGGHVSRGKPPPRPASPAAAEQARLAAAVWRAGSRAAADAADALAARAAAWRDRALAAERALGGSGGAGRGGYAPHSTTAARAAPAPVSAALAAARRASRLSVFMQQQAPGGRRGTAVAGQALPPQPASGTSADAEDADAGGDRAALAAAAAEVRALTSRLATAEAAADAAIDALSRAEAAEAAAAEAAARAGARTPRPPPPMTGSGVRALAAAGVADAGPAIAAAAAACRGWAARDVAAALLGDDPGSRGAAFAAPDALGCLGGGGGAAADTTLTPARVAAALAARDGATLLAALPPGSPHAAWLGARAGVGLAGARADALALFLCGGDGRGRALPLSVYGTLPAADDGAVERAVLEAAAPTAERVARLEREVARLTAGLEAVARAGGGSGGGGAAAADPAAAAALAAAALAGQDVSSPGAAAAIAAAAAAAASAAPPPIPTARPAPGLETFVAALEAAAAAAGSADAADASTWKAGFPGLGNGGSIPRLLRTAAPRIRNKGLSKRETERTVKEVWREREAAASSGAVAAREPLIDFLYAHLQKKLGIPTAVVEAGYNLIYGLWKYRWDADCELFLAVLAGRVREDVHAAQAELQADMVATLAAVERAVVGGGGGSGGPPSGPPPSTAAAASAGTAGTLSKAVLRDALRAYFRVGAPGGKSAPRFDALLQALDAVAPGGPSARVAHASLFAEDREFNQGEFAEAVRDQALAERLEFFGEVERALAARVAGRGGGGVGGGGDDGAAAVVTRADVAAALQACDAGLPAKAAWDRANDAFEAGVPNAPAAAVMARLRAGTGRRLRASSAASSGGGSVSWGGGGGGGSLSGGSGGGGSMLAAGRGGRGGPGLLPKKGGPRLSPAGLAAVEAVRAAWGGGGSGGGSGVRAGPRMSVLPPALSRAGRASIMPPPVASPPTGAL